MSIPPMLHTRVNPAWLECWRYANGASAKSYRDLYMAGNVTLTTPDMLISD